MIISTKNINVGDEVFANFSGLGAIYVRKGRVTAKSATGVIFVDFNRVDGSGKPMLTSFNGTGVERSPCSRWRAAQLITLQEYNDLLARQTEQQKERKARDAVNAISKISIDDRAALIAALENALEAVKLLD